METSDTEIKISGKLINQSQNIATAQITNLLMLETIDPLIKPKNEIDQMPSLIVAADEGKDYFSLGPNKQKSFSYVLPISQYVPQANYRISLRFIRSSGQEEAYYSDVIKNFGSSKKDGFLAFDQQSCVLFSKEGKRFGNNAGPAFLPGESPKISCLIKNIGDQEIEVSPKILWKEVFVYGKPLDGKLATEKQDEKIIFKSGESKTVSLFMPIAEKPQTYQGLLSFEDENGLNRSFSEFFRWTIAGESARIKTVAQTGELKDFYDKGDKVALSVDYFGSSDLYWAGTQDVSNLSDLTMKTVIKDKDGIVCGEKEELVDDITDGQSKNKEVEIILSKKCKEMSYSVFLSSGQKSLTEQSGDLPKLVNRQNTLQYLYFGAPAFLMLLAFYLFIRKKSVPVYFFIFALAGVAMFSVSVLAETKTFPASGGLVTSWEWGGDWINDTNNETAKLYSAKYSNNVSVLNPGYVSVQLANFFVENTNNGSVEFEYYAQDAGCENTSMEVDYEVFMGANGEEEFLTSARISYISNSGSNVRQFVNIPADKINWLYDSEGIPKANPKLIVKMKQIGTYDDVFYRGTFDLSNATSQGTTKENAYALSDNIRIEVPLKLPVPTLRIDPQLAVINPGQTKQFSVFYDADGPENVSSEKEVTAEIKIWLGDKTAVASVDSAGKVTAIASGSAKIYAVYYRGLFAKATVSVPTLRIGPAMTMMNPGDSKQFNALYDEDGPGKNFAEKKVTIGSEWSSNNAGVISVKNDLINKGKAKAWAVGSAVIIARYSGLEAFSLVQVFSTPITLAVSCSSEPSVVFLNETTKFSADVFGGTAPYSYSWTGGIGDDGLSGSGETISKSYQTSGIKTATVEVKDKVGAIASNTCSVEVKDGTIGECDIVKDQCLIGVLDDITDSESQYLWNCVGTKSTDYCSLDKLTNDPSYNVSPDNKELEVGKSWQFTGIYNSDKTGTSADDSDVTNLANWTSYDTSIATISTSGSTRGLATCLKPSAEGEDIVITSTYKDESSTDFTDTATLSCSFDKVSAWITATPSEVYENNVTTVEWGSSENAISCEHLDGGNDSEWKKINKSATSGSFTTSSFGKINRTYAIKCTDNISVAEDSVEIKVIEPKKLTVEVVGNGMTLNNAVISGDEIKLIDCKEDCSGNYYFDSEVILKADPKRGYFLSKWDGCDSIDGNFCYLTMDDDKTVKATFVKEGEIIITASDITATIVAGLTTNSYYSKKAGEENLKVSNNSGCDSGSLELTADYSKTDKDAGGDFVFYPANNGSFPYNGNFYVKNILGKTLEGKYPITLTATCILNTTKETIGKTAEINLVIKKILSDWQEI